MCESECECECECVLVLRACAMVVREQWQCKNQVRENEKMDLNMYMYYLIHSAVWVVSDNVCSDLSLRSVTVSEEFLLVVEKFFTGFS